MIDQLGIIQEALRRSLESGYLTADKRLNVPQLEALVNYHSFVSEVPDHARIDRRNVYVDMATGTGKTGFFSVIVRHARLIAQDQGLGEQFKVVIVEPTTLLLKQTYNAIVATAPEQRSSIGIFGGGSKDLNSPITIMTYDAWAELKSQGLLDDVSLEVSDESHRGLSDLRQQIRRDNFSNAVHLGVTASAQYDSQKTMDITHQNLIYRIGLRDAIERDFLTNYAHVQYGLMRVLPNLAGRPEQNLARGELPALKQLEWSRLVIRNYATMFDEISGQALSDKIGAIFTANTRHADNHAAMINRHPVLSRIAKERGFRDVAVSVHTVDVPDREQERRLEGFQAGEYMVITGDKKIQAGFDHPPVKYTACFPGNSLVDVVQEIGRSTRRWIDPTTGIPQGTVIFETVPYIGSASPEEDRKAQTRALANTVTAYEILKGMTVYAPGRRAMPAEPTEEPRTQVVVSPTCTAEVFTSERDSLLISRLIDDARKELRIEITPVMLDDLKEKVALRGRYSGMRLAGEIEKYEAARHLESTGLLHYEISGVLYGQVKSMKIIEWMRLNDTLDAMPLIEPGDRIQVTDRMLENLKAKIAIHGGFSYVRLSNEVTKYEAERGLASTGLTLPTIARIIVNSIKTIEAAQWQRLDDVVSSLPERLSDRIQITPMMVADLNEKIKSRGRFGPTRIMREVERYEEENQVAGTGLSGHIFAALINGYVQSVEVVQWQRLHAVLDGIPSLKLNEYTLVTSEMIAGVKARFAVRGIPGPRSFIKMARDYEREKKLYGVRLNVEDVAAILAEQTTSMHTVKWQRLNEVIESIPETGGRVQITPEVFDQLKRKITERGNFGARRLMQEVGEYEGREEAASVGLTEPIISSVLGQQVASMNAMQWERFNAVIDGLPLLETHARIEVTPEMLVIFKDRIKAKGSLEPHAIEKAVARYERANDLDPLDITKTIITALIKGRYKTVAVPHWERINLVLDGLPVALGRDRVRITKKMFDDTKAKILRKGDLGTRRIINEVSAYETAHSLATTGLTTGVLSSVFFEMTVKTMASSQWQRLNDALDALPEVEDARRTEISDTMLAALIEKVSLRGNYGAKRLIRAVSEYEGEHGLAAVGLSDQLINHALGGRAKTLRAAQWQRLNDAVDALPILDRKRITLTEAAVSELNEQIASRGNFGAVLLLRAVRAYEERQKLPESGLTVDVITRIIKGQLSSAIDLHWSRLHETVLSLALQEPTPRIEVTGKTREALLAKIEQRGGFGGVRLARAVSVYEEEHSVEAVGLDKDLLHKFISGKLQSLEQRQLDRLNVVLDELPTAKPPEFIDITPDMILGLKRRVGERGGFGATRLLQAAEAEEHAVQLTWSYISQFLVTNSIVRSTDRDRWNRLNEVVNNLPLQAAGSLAMPRRERRPRTTKPAGVLSTGLQEIFSDRGFDLSSRKSRLGDRDAGAATILDAFEEVLNETQGDRGLTSLSSAQVIELIPTVAARAMVGFKIAERTLLRAVPEFFQSEPDNLDEQKLRRRGRSRKIPGERPAA